MSKISRAFELNQKQSNYKVKRIGGFTTLPEEVRFSEALLGDMGSSLVFTLIGAFFLVHLKCEHLNLQ